MNTYKKRLETLKKLQEESEKMGFYSSYTEQLVPDPFSDAPAWILLGGDADVGHSWVYKTDISIGCDLLFEPESNMFLVAIKGQSRNYETKQEALEFAYMFMSKTGGYEVPDEEAHQNGLKE